MSLIRSLIGVASLFLISVCSAQEVDLQITDTRGRALQAISAGTPFMIRVQVDGSGVISGRPTVAHDEHLVVRGSSSKQQSINGVLSRQFEYLVLLDETVPEGAYTIGPAVVTLNGDPQQSETRTITVGEHAQAEEKSDAEQGLRLSVDKDKVCVGEKVLCTLRWYIDDPTTRMRNFLTPQAKAFTVKEARGPFEGQEVDAAGNRKRYVEWHWDAYPKEAGSLELPAYGVDYEVEPEDQFGRRGLISMFFMNHFEPKRTYSNAVPLTVNPLPDTVAPGTLVGTIQSIDVRINPGVLPRGEAAVLSVDVVGDVDVDLIDLFPLQGMPEELRYYESKKLTEFPAREGGLARRHFEFIVQGLEEGSWPIPAQELSYFDTKSRTHKICHSVPLTVKVEPSLVPIPSKASESAVADADIESGSASDVIPLWQDEGSGQDAGDERQLPLSLLLALLALPVSYSIFVRGRGVWNDYYTHHGRWFRMHLAYWHARQQLRKIKRGQGEHSVYQVMVRCVADKTGCAEYELSRNALEQSLGSHLDTSRRIRWNRFLERAAECAFAQSTIQSHDALISEGQEWLAVLKKEL